MSEYNPVTRIKVFGVGGGGCNAVNRMVGLNAMGADFYVVNTDKQNLQASKCENKILIGYNTTHGLGAGGNPEVGKAAALESESELRDAVQNADMIFVTTGLGGGTGTGAAPVLARIARESGALTIGIVTKPFSFEGKRRMMQAINGLDELKQYVDSLIIVPNERVSEYLGKIPFNQAFLQADNVLVQAVKTITDLVSYNAIINLDFADIKSTLANQGTALIGVGQVSPSDVNDKDDMPREAALRAVSCPLLESSISGARKCIINVSGGESLTIDSANAAVKAVEEEAGGDIDVIFGLSYNENLQDTIVVTVIATGYDNVKPEDTFDKRTLDGNESIGGVDYQNAKIPSFFEHRND